MKKVLKIAALSAAGLFVVVTAVGFLLPQKLRAERSVVVNAPPEAVYPFIANFKDGWSQWSPFTTPDMTFSYDGPEVGVGAEQRWNAAESGDGWLRIVKADPSRGVEMEMGMMQDSYKATASLLCEPTAQGTEVTWTDDIDMGSNPYRRYLGLVLGPMIESEFDKGLAALKVKVEASAVAKN